MTDLTPEKRDEWRQDSMERNSRPPTTWFDDRILTLLDALDDAEHRVEALTEEVEKQMTFGNEQEGRAEQAERALTEIHPQSAALYMRMSAELRDEKARADAMNLANEVLAEEVAGLSRMHVESVEYGDRLRAQFERAEAERDELRWCESFTVSECENREHADFAIDSDVALTCPFCRLSAAEAALSRVLTEVKALGMRADGIVDTDGGRWVPCADILAVVAKHQNVKETND